MRTDISVSILMALAAGLPFAGATAAEGAHGRPVPDAVAVKGEPPPPSEGATDLKFREFFRMPVGPRGLEPTGKLLGLNGREVRIVGYLADRETSPGGLLYLTPFPIELSEEDEPLADDLPATTVFVHLRSGGNPLPHSAGLIRLTGRLSVGAKEEPDGRVSVVRLELDPEPARSLTGNGEDRREKHKRPGR